ncbi:hypothetical protein ASPWEDRAFT_730388 [Aspergillus wentii DTO 134E9]|uniref:Thioesterase domain-containing protein n=1 Tax=Aspergillus wentii DTO 134E9 TaxID=1073089 RepID=A0A1L9RYR7_ASPWE|nr:uncharacterized protein ASPWEDRAFT_730388 [Aspergillus wentii DTO 134E9]KAI9932545.1 hypothetical protein MW887_008787 [Aspergillus wentii]OJJ40110.1 hypothetical protein ASPWEDRAFT_730388 [Aspergillus wentii DTO 134E9]
MRPFKSALEASSYQHPASNGPWAQRRDETISKMLEQGLEYPTLAEHPIAWAEDQDPFGHVMTQTYPHINAKCFLRLLESFEEQLKDRFPDFMKARGIGIMSNRLVLSMKRVVKYPDLLITGVRLVEVRPDRIFFENELWSAQTKEMVAGFQMVAVFFNHHTGKKANLLEEGGVWADLHASLLRRSAESNRTLGIWQEKQKRQNNGKL